MRLPAWKEQQITALMQCELSRKLPVARLAESAGLSVRHFSRAFRLATGRSPHRYLLELRLGKARALLLSPTVPLHEVALACGFADQSHFTRTFQAAEKLTPARWRRHHCVSDLSNQHNSGAAGVLVESHVPILQYPGGGIGDRGAHTLPLTDWTG